MANTIKLLENLLDYCAVKNKVISKNIANVGTENYKREEVQFKNLFESNINSTLKTENSKHFGVSNAGSDSEKFEVVLDKESEETSGINNVNIEDEMSQLAENTLRFKFASKKSGEYYRSIQNVIKGGGRV
ncbi:MAG: flagellar basal body rod protein FlgB [Melioribacteraceae bacterium]|nr:flagellar basal body rod protein FlgB [Melioribacteraceae bacterium]